MEILITDLKELRQHFINKSNDYLNKAQNSQVKPVQRKLYLERAATWREAAWFIEMTRIVPEPKEEEKA